MPVCIPPDRVNVKFISYTWLNTNKQTNKTLMWVLSTQDVALLSLNLMWHRRIAHIHGRTRKKLIYYFPHTVGLRCSSHIQLFLWLKLTFVSLFTAAFGFVFVLYILCGVGILFLNAADRQRSINRFLRRRTKRHILTNECTTTYECMRRRLQSERSVFMWVCAVLNESNKSYFSLQGLAMSSAVEIRRKKIETKLYYYWGLVFVGVCVCMF